MNDPSPANPLEPRSRTPSPMPENWHHYVVAAGVCKNQPGLYEWHIEGAGTYIGKYTHISRPTRQYATNVARLLAGKCYRPSNPNGFRRIHKELAKAYREGRKITLTILKSVPREHLNTAERELIAERGDLNDPPFGRRV